VVAISVGDWGDTQDRAPIEVGCGAPLGEETVLDPVIDRVKRTDRLSCFVDRLHRLVDDFTT